MRWWKRAAVALVVGALLALATVWALREANVIRWGASGAALDRIEVLKDRIKVLEQQAAPAAPSAESAREAAEATRAEAGVEDSRERVDAPPAAVLVRLERVVDGDTIDVRIGETDERVRLIGIDTPERGQPGADEATARLEALLADVALYLEADTTERDRYERLLRYVWTLDDAGIWTLVNLTLVTEGLATAYPFPPDEKYAERFGAAEAVARAERRGIWTSAAEPQAEPTPGGGECDPSYPGVCIPPPPPDLDCGEIPFRRFRVTGADPHRFDRDRDGVGCES